jgi:hypothetical protein
MRSALLGTASPYWRAQCSWRALGGTKQYSVTLHQTSSRRVKRESKAVSADGKPLAGAAKKSFVQKCKKDACEPKAVDSNGNPLKGTAKNSFLKKCKKGA